MLSLMLMQTLIMIGIFIWMKSNYSGASFLGLRVFSLEKAH